MATFGRAGRGTVKPMSSVQGIGAKEFARCCGVSYRVVDYWDRTDVLRPSLHPARGSGSQRRYSADDARVGRALGVLSRLGATGPALRRAAAELDGLGVWTGHVYVHGAGSVHLAMPEGGAWCLDLTWCQRHPCCNAPQLAVAV